MTHPFRTRRLALFAASTAIAAGGVLVPTTAFAATPGTPHTVVADGEGGDSGTKSTLLLFPDGPGNRVIVIPDEDGSNKDRPGKWGDWKWGDKRPGKGGSPDVVAPGPGSPWQCVTAPCGPPGTDESTTLPGHAPPGAPDANSIRQT
ncbi:hypothetical protein ACWDYJ_24370 [Streptomyces sp. NPDC003042]